ncbi:MAG: winged helix-turn-helix domain-containing protein [Nitrososphaera sp.]
MKNRSSIDILSQVLEAANGGATKTKIMYRALLSYKQIKEYVNLLTERGLLVYDYHHQDHHHHNQHNHEQGKAQHTFIKTTEKGLSFLETYNRLDDMLKETEDEREEIQQQALRLPPQLQMQMWKKREEGKE